MILKNEGSLNPIFARRANPNPVDPILNALWKPEPFAVRYPF